MKFDRVISLCDGISMARDSLADAGIVYDRYYAVEIDEVARKIADWRFASVTTFRPKHDIREVDDGLVASIAKNKRTLIIAGIPCIERSTANKNNSGEARVGEGTQSGDLLREFARILAAARKVAKRVEFIVENVPSSPKADSVYNKALGVLPVRINAAAFGAQHRERLFWAEWQIPTIPESEWSKEVFADIAEKNPKVKKFYDFVWYPSQRKRAGKPNRLGVLPVPGVLRQMAKANEPVTRVGGSHCTVVSKHAKAKCVLSSQGGRRKPLVADDAPPDGVTASIQDRVYERGSKVKTIPARGGGRTEGLVNALSADSVQGGKAYAKDGKMPTQGSRKRKFEIDGKELELPVVVQGARALTVTEIERLFGLPDGATAAPGVSRSARIRCLGSGWHVKQVGHCLRALHDYKPAQKASPLLA